MSFQRNARATFVWRAVDVRASVIALAVTFGTSFAIISTPQTSIALAYVFLLNMVVLVCVVFWMTTQPPVNLLSSSGSRRWYSVGQIWRPILLGLIVTFSVYILLLVLFAFQLGNQSAQQNLRDVLLFAVFIGFVEEFMRWVWIQVLPWGLITANLLWVLLHPEVAPILSGQTWSPFFAVFALSFGFAMSAIMWLYETPLPWGLNRYLGPILAATIHAGYDALVIVWKVELVVPSAGRVSFGPMIAPLVLIFLPAVLLPWAMSRRRSRARLRGARSPRGT